MMTLTFKGELADLYPSGIKWNVKSVAEGLRAVEANFGGLFRYFNDATARGVEIGFFVNNRNIKENELRITNPPDSECVIMPVPAGSKQQGLISTIIGVIVVAVVAYFTWGAGAGSAAAAWFGASSTTGAMLMGVGLSMAFSGIAMMVAGQPKFHSPEETPGNNPSAIFNGPTNRTRQGNVYPVVYGKMLVGSQRVSAAIVNEDYSSPYYGNGYVGAPTYGGENPYGNGPGPGASSGNNTGAVGYGGDGTYDETGYTSYNPGGYLPSANYGFTNYTIT